MKVLYFMQLRMLFYLRTCKTIAEKKNFLLGVFDELPLTPVVWRKSYIYKNPIEVVILC